MRFVSSLKDYTGHATFATMTLTVFRRFRDDARHTGEGRQASEKTKVDFGMFYDEADNTRYINLDDLQEVIRHVTDVELVGPDGEQIGLAEVKDEARCPYPVAVWLLLCYSEWLGRSLSFFRPVGDDVGVPG